MFAQVACYNSNAIYIERVFGVRGLTVAARDLLAEYLL